MILGGKMMEGGLGTNALLIDDFTINHSMLAFPPYFRMLMTIMMPGAESLETRRVSFVESNHIAYVVS